MLLNGSRARRAVFVTVTRQHRAAGADASDSPGRTLCEGVPGRGRVAARIESVCPFGAGTGARPRFGRRRGVPSGLRIQDRAPSRIVAREQVMEFRKRHSGHGGHRTATRRPRADAGNDPRRKAEPREPSIEPPWP
jgi:hypothetical protein